jgi:hypothetical protein
MAEAQSSSSRARLNGDEIFRRLAESGFEFLRRSIDEASAEPRFAVVHFATAIELLLKARLLREHWALIVRNSGDADQESFVRGEARTITGDEALRRLEKIAGVVIPAEAASEFRKIAAHRNRVLHFFHATASSEVESAEADRVLREQHRGWFYLSLLLDEWSQHFGEFRQEIMRVRSRMKSHTEYLAVVYNSIKPTIDARELAGEVFVRCESCHHPSAARTAVSRNVALLNCAVCEIVDSMVTFECVNEDCGQTIEVHESHPGHRSCPGCRSFYNNAQLAEVLDTAATDPFEYVPRNCALCTSPDSVVQNDDVYVCTECLTVDNAIYKCEWCSELQLGGGDLENSYLSGCEFCEGRGGFEPD